MASLSDVYLALSDMRAEGVLQNYAIGGGMAALFYAETTRTYDIDVFALIHQRGLLVDLSGIYDWARGRGYAIEAEHILIHSVPVQFLAARDGLETEAIERARLLDYSGVPVPVMAPEYLAVIYVLTGGGKRRDRTRALFEAGAIDRDTLREILERHGLTTAWQQKWGDDNE